MEELLVLLLVILLVQGLAELLVKYLLEMFLLKMIIANMLSTGQEILIRVGMLNRLSSVVLFHQCENLEIEAHSTISCRSQDILSS